LYEEFTPQVFVGDELRGTDVEIWDILAQKLNFKLNLIFSIGVNKNIAKVVNKLKLKQMVYYIFRWQMEKQIWFCFSLPFLGRDFK